MLSKLSMMALAGSVLMASCTSFIEEPAQIQQVTDSEILAATASSEDPNAKKAVERSYSERFTNQLTPMDENGNVNPINPVYFPGTGVGNSSHMGKARTFLNQRVDGSGTIGAPVTQFFSDALEALGITINNSDVSSVTTDGKGNSIWFENVENIASPSSATRIDFEAKVNIIGGTGKFEGATGAGTFIGFFNPNNGQGSSTIEGKITY